MDVSHAILFLENADFVRITGLYFPAKFELIYIDNHIYLSPDSIPFVYYDALSGKAATEPTR